MRKLTNSVSYSCFRASPATSGVGMEDAPLAEAIMEPRMEPLKVVRWDGEVIIMTVTLIIVNSMMGVM